MDVQQIIDKVTIFDDADFNNRGGCLTLEQERQLVDVLKEKTEALSRIARRWPCETAGEMADEARRAL